MLHQAFLHIIFIGTERLLKLTFDAIKRVSSKKAQIKSDVEKEFYTKIMTIRA